MEAENDWIAMQGRIQDFDRPGAVSQRAAYHIGDRGGIVENL